MITQLDQIIWPYDSDSFPRNLWNTTRLQKEETDSGVIRPSAMYSRASSIDGHWTHPAYNIYLKTERGEIKQSELSLLSYNEDTRRDNTSDPK